MRILWVEDKGEVVKTSIFDKKMFNNFWNNTEIENLKVLRDKLSEEYKMELENYSVPLFLASDLEEAWEIIEGNEPFDKIIIDIEFPSEDFDFDNKYIKEAFHGEKRNFKNLIDFINQDEYMGFTLAHLVISHYKKTFDWKPSDINEKIVFFSANSLTMEDFEKKFKLSMKKDFIYNPETKRIKQFNKNDEDNFLKWLKTDRYTLILDKYIGNSAVNNFLEIEKNKNNSDATVIKGNLVNLRQLLENHIAKTVVRDIEENSKYFPEWNLELKKRNGINFGGFILLLNSIKPRMDFKKGKEKGYGIVTKDELSKLIEIVEPNYHFDGKTDSNYKFSIGSLMTFMEQKSENSFDSIKQNAKNIKSLTFGYENRFNEELLVTEDIYNYITYSWRKLSELIHDEGNLTSEGECFIKNSEIAVNIINILYYQLKQIILWFGKVMEKIDAED